jgi:hypothetical protein
LQNESIEILKYLIFDLSFEKTQSVNDYLSKFSLFDPLITLEKVRNFFTIRDLNDKLEKDLPQKILNQNRKNKI